MTAFSAMLIACRAERGYSQNRLAHEAGFDASYVSKLESGTREPSRDTVLALAEVLELPALDRGRLLFAAGYVPENPIHAALLACEAALAVDVTSEERTVASAALATLRSEVMP